MMVTNTLYSRDALRAFIQSKPLIEYQVRLDEARKETPNTLEYEVAEKFLDDHSHLITSILKFKNAHWDEDEPIATETINSAAIFHELLIETEELAEDAMSSDRLLKLREDSE